MKKLLGACLVAGIALAPVVQADMIGFEIGGYQWKPDYEGTIQSNSNLIIGDKIDIKDDLGFSDSSNNIFWASLEHPLPFIPNIKIVSSDIDTSANATLSRSIVFNGQTYSVQDNIDTFVDLSNIEYTLYYELLDNWINLDAGLTIRQYDGEMRIASTTNTSLNEFEDIDFTIPLLYLKGRVDLPLTGFFVDAEVNVISYDDDQVSDLLIGVGYESEIGLGGKLGYRTLDLDVDEKDFLSDIKSDGTYISVFYHF